MTMVPLEIGSVKKIVLVTHACVPRIEQMTTTEPRLVRKPDRNINVFCVVGIFSGKKLPVIE